MFDRTRAVAAAAVAGVMMLAVLGSASARPVTTASGAFWIASFDHKLLQADRDALQARGLDVVDYVPSNSYLVWGTMGSATAADRLAGVSTAPLAASRKVHASLIGVRGIVRVDISAHRSALPALRASVASLGTILGTDEALSSGPVASVVASVPASAVAGLAARPDVMFVGPASTGLHAEDEATTQIQAGNINGSNRPVPGYAAWLAQEGLDGTGVIVSVVDTGIDPLHPDLAGRITRIEYGNPAESERADTGGHGTHVAGIIGGAPTAQTALLEDPDGFAFGQGVAPKVSFINQNALGTFTGFDLKAELERFSRDAYRGGARIWNSSWHTGEGNRPGYLLSHRTMDVLTRDADVETAGSEEFLFVFSAGNAGASGPTAPHEAKNIIAVGASNSGRGAVAYGLSSDIDGIASFSSRGPAKDGRIFPTISAPGANVMSARSTAGTSCNTPDAAIYAICSGTSMAAPHVTGAAALIHQWWKNDHADDLPSPALVKALLVNSATDMGSKNIPNRDEGWGRVNLGSLFGDTAGLFQDQQTSLGAPGETAAQTVTVADATKPLKVTLAWSDAPGTAVGGDDGAAPEDPALVNDLDLVVEQLDAAGNVTKTFYGNNFTKGWSVAASAPDRLNNLENVYIEVPSPGEYRVTVVAANVPGDGVPFSGDETDQDFALVIRGGI